MITIKNIRTSDYQSLKSYVTNRDVAKFLTWKPYVDEKEIRKFFYLSIKLNTYPDQFLGIFCQNKMIGTAHLIARKNKKAQFGFGVLPRFWGNDIGNQIVKQMILYVKKTAWDMHSDAIIADVHEENMFVIHALEENGFTKVRRQPKMFSKRYRYLYPI